jgi:hypothetical protein
MAVTATVRLNATSEDFGRHEVIRPILLEDAIVV